jgi:hypothetical protein
MQRRYINGAVIALGRSGQVRLIEGFTIDKDLATLDLDAIARQANDTLDKQIGMWINAEYHHITTMRASHGPPVIVRDFLYDQTLVSVQIGLHTLAVNACGLRQQQVDEQSDDHSRDHRFKNFAQNPQQMSAWRDDLIWLLVLLCHRLWIMKLISHDISLCWLFF